jgi:hypothetical protein
MAHTKITMHARERTPERGADLTEVKQLLDNKNFKVLRKVQKGCTALLVKLRNGLKIVPIVRILEAPVRIKLITTITWDQYQQNYPTKTYRVPTGFTIRSLIDKPGYKLPEQLRVKRK